MANNRLWLVDDTTGDFVCRAKGSGDWALWDAKLLDQFLQAHDFGGACGGATNLRLVGDCDADSCDTTVCGESWKP